MGILQGVREMGSVGPEANWKVVVDQLPNCWYNNTTALEAGNNTHAPSPAWLLMERLKRLLTWVGPKGE